MTKAEKLEDIRKHPDKHRHGIEGLAACCTVMTGILDYDLVTAHTENSIARRTGAHACESVRVPGNLLTFFH